MLYLLKVFKVVFFKYVVTQKEHNLLGKRLSTQE